MRAFSRFLFVLLLPGTALGAALLGEFLIYEISDPGRGTFVSRAYPYWFTLFLVAPVFFWIFAGTNRLFFSACLGCGPVLLIALAHAFKARILGEVLFVSDFFPTVLAALLRVMPGLGDAFLLGVAGGLVGLALLVFLLTRVYRLRFGGAALATRLSAAVIVSLPALTALGAGGDFARGVDRAFSLKYDVFNRRRNYRVMGLPAALFFELRDLVRARPPSGYNRAAIARLTGGRAPANEAKAPRTSIFLVLAETFWDPQKFPELAVSPDPIPFFRSMLRAGAGGELVVPALGGGTVKTEFEVLTGLTSRFVDGYPYSTAVTRRVPSLASHLRERGYRTVAVHGYYGWFYNRNRAMPLLGFDRFIHRGHMLTDASLAPEPGLRRLDARRHLRDGYLLAVSRRQMGLHRPAFVYASTYGTHGPYIPVRREGAPDFRVNTKIKGADREKLLGALIHLWRADRAIGALVRYYRERRERVLIVVFGDHLPARVYLPALPRDTGPGRDRMFRVPYFFWSNYPRENGKLPALISSNFLAPLILREAGMTLPPRWRLLERLRGKVPVFSLMKKTQQGDWSRSLPDDPVYRKFLRDYRLLQYDLLYGQGFAAGPR